MTDQTKAGLEVVAHLYANDFGTLKVDQLSPPGDGSFAVVRQSDAAAEVARLRAEVAQLNQKCQKSALDSLSSEGQLQDEIDALRAEIERLTKSLADANDQCRLKDRKIDHITKACEESDAAVVAERDACAKIVEAPHWKPAVRQVLAKRAAEIRARGEQ